MKISRENLNFNAISLFEMALEVTRFSYAPYSHFRVGSALLLGDGSIVKGVNVENRSYGLTICAERVAICSAIAKGHQDFVAIALATPDSKESVPPCGACRQVLSEFMPPNTPIIFGSSKEDIVIVTLGELYPLDSLHELKR